jgi:predicted nucleic acid-binding protein
MPMRIIVSDSSCLIDLRKASLLDVFLQLPYEILIPNTLFEDELIKFTVEQKEALVRGGLQIVDLPGDGVLRAQKVVGALPHLSIHDGFAFALAEQNPGCILLTGDSGLRNLGEEHRMEVHGVLWIIDEIHANGLAAREVLLSVLRGFGSDQTVRLPKRELAACIKRYEKEE